MSTRLVREVGAGVACLLLMQGTASAAGLDMYLIVGEQINNSTVDVSNYELGRVSALADSAPTVNSPGVGPSVSDTPTYDGNIAVTDSDSTILLSDVNVYANTGIDCAGSYANCTSTGGNFSNSFYDDAAGGSGLRGFMNGDGVNESQDLTTLNNQLTAVKAFIAGLTLGDVTGTISTTSGDVLADTVVNLASGLNILTFDSTSDITVKANLIFQGGADAFAVVLVQDGQTFKTSQGNLVIGNGGIGLNNVLIVGDDSSQQQFDISNTNINGVALWDLSGGDSNLSVDNMSGCTQLVGSDVDISNVRLSRCAFDASVIPIPGAVWLFGSAIGLLGWFRARTA